MLKASKKALANNITKMTEEEKFIEQYRKDMEPTSEQKELQAQRDKYLNYITKKLETWQSDFLVSMKTKLIEGTVLTPNMTSAIDKCMARDAEYEAKKAEPEKPVDESKLPKVTFKMSLGWTKLKGFKSRVITGVILKETERAYLMKGYTDMVLATYCMCCGRELTEPASMIIGMGATCADNLGVPYPTDILLASEKVRKAYRKKLQKVLNNEKFETWVPKSQIKEDLTK